MSVTVSGTTTMALSTKRTISDPTEGKLQPAVAGTRSPLAEADLYAVHLL